ncbi:hypothetical protein BDR07DRAFT_1490934 [Suillus spraguei]|nr:hypothetical protein BDR07DRAFT_1490934 [Suillus spraguei]
MSSVYDTAEVGTHAYNSVVRINPAIRRKAQPRIGDPLSGGSLTADEEREHVLALTVPVSRWAVLSYQAAPPTMPDTPEVCSLRALLWGRASELPYGQQQPYALVYHVGASSLYWHYSVGEQASDRGEKGYKNKVRSQSLEEELRCFYATALNYMGLGRRQRVAPHWPNMACARIMFLSFSASLLLGFFGHLFSSLSGVSDFNNY